MFYENLLKNATDYLSIVVSGSTIYMIVRGILIVMREDHVNIVNKCEQWASIRRRHESGSVPKSK